MVALEKQKRGNASRIAAGRESSISGVTAVMARNTQRAPHHRLQPLPHGGNKSIARTAAHQEHINA